MASSEMDVDAQVKAFAFTTKNYRDVYPAIDPSRPELSQAGKVIVITGASRGLGRQSFAASFARVHAAAIVLIGRSAEGLAETEKLIHEISPDTKVLTLAVNVTDEAGVNDAFKEIKARFGVPHVLINNAGYLSPLETIGDSPLDAWWQAHEVNVKGTVLVTKAFLKETGTQPSAPTTIINLTSMASQGVPPGMSAYSTSKLAMTKFTVFLSTEYPAITSVNIDPGTVPTDMGHAVPFLAPFLFDTPEIVGGAAVWLASGDKKFLSGRYVLVNWDVEELERRKEEIQEGNLLTPFLRGTFGIPGAVVEPYGK